MASLRTFAFGRLNLFQSNGQSVPTVFQNVISKSHVHKPQYAQLSCCIKHTLRQSKVTHLRQSINNARQKSGHIYKLPSSRSGSGIYQQTCLFHTTPRRQIPPIFLALLQPLAKISAALAGRFARRWFKGLKPQERKSIWASIKKHWYIPASGLGLLLGSSVVYYFTHIEEAPITGRRRFVSFTHSQIMKIADAECKKLEAVYGAQLYKQEDMEAIRVIDVMSRLLKANPEMNNNLPFDKWEMYVVDDDLCNACVMPNGCVFVFRGMLDLAETQDELAIVMGHEVAHAVLSHGVEELSMTSFVNYFVILCLAAIWCVLPNDGVAVITHWFYNKVIMLMTHMPHSRMLEKEADKVGLLFAARACFDVRCGSVLWRKMALNEKLSKDTEQLPEWMSTHPDSMKRAEHLDFLLPQAEVWREPMKCPPLPKDDPRKAIIAISKEVNNQLRARQAGQNLAQVPQVGKVPQVATHPKPS